jgi:hypothetical protein
MDNYPKTKFAQVVFGQTRQHGVVYSVINLMRQVKLVCSMSKKLTQVNTVSAHKNQNLTWVRSTRVVFGVRRPYHPYHYLLLYSILSVQLHNKCKPSLLPKTTIGLKLKCKYCNSNNNNYKMNKTNFIVNKL